VEADLQEEHRRAVTLVAQWHEWFSTASRDEGSGWETNWPEWPAAHLLAVHLMLALDLAPESIKLIEVAWAVSHEDQIMLEEAASLADRLLPILRVLTKSQDANVRWQAYQALAHARSSDATKILWAGCRDEDEYCRRRAMLALSQHDRELTPRIVMEHLHDPDGYLRMILVRLAREYSPSLFEAAAQQLRNDKDVRVHDEIRELRRNSK